MKRNARIALALVLVPLTLGLSAFGYARSRSPEEKLAHAEGWVKDKLELDEAQGAKLDALGSEILGLVKDFHAGRDADLDQVLAAVKGNLDRQTLDPLVAKRRATIDEHLPRVLDKLVAFQNSLTPEQKEEVAQFLQKMHDRRRNR